jgi:hypothetical protein
MPPVFPSGRGMAFTSRLSSTDTYTFSRSRSVSNWQRMVTGESDEEAWRIPMKSKAGKFII